MDISVRNQTYRGKTSKVDDEKDYIWERVSQRGNLYTYRVNRQSGIYEMVRNKISEEAQPYLDMLIEEIENNVPYQQIYIDKSQNIFYYGKG